MGRHEIPTKLEVEDKVVFGMTARQLLCVGMGSALGYVLSQRVSHLPLPHAGPVPLLLVAAILAGLLPISLTLAVAFIRPADRALETWAMALLHYTQIPKRCVWRPVMAAEEEDVADALAHLESWPAEPDAHIDPAPLHLTPLPGYQDIMHGR